MIELFLQVNRSCGVKRFFRRFETFPNGYRGQKGRAFNGPMTLGTKKKKKKKKNKTNIQNE